MKKDQLDKLKKRFVEYVRKKGGMGLCDSLGGPLDFYKNGRPMWNQDLVIYMCADSVNIRLFKGGCLCEEDGRPVARFIREFAADNDVFHVPVSFDSLDDDGSKDFTLEISASFEIERPKKPAIFCDADWTWVIGDLESMTFLGEKEEYETHYADVGWFDNAVHFDTFEDAVSAMVSDEGVFSWVDEHGFADRIIPIKVGLRTVAMAARK